MPLKDYLSVIDNQLKAVFERKAASPAKLRRPLIKGIDRALTQFRTGGAGSGKGWWRVKNDVVALTVKLDGKTYDINGADTNYIPADRFKEFLERMREAVDAGEFDAEIANKGEGPAQVAVQDRAVAKAQAPRRRGGTISPEAAKARGIKAAASRKANREKAGKPS